MRRKGFTESTSVEPLERQVELHLRDRATEIGKPEALVLAGTKGRDQGRCAGVLHHGLRDVEPFGIDAVAVETLTASILQGLLFPPVETLEYAV